MTIHLNSKSARFLAGAAFAAALLTGVSTAAASPNFPDVLAEVADTACVPQCTVCHSTNPGRQGSGNKPFATFGVVNGLPTTGGTDEQARAAFEAMKLAATAAVDANLDGVDDVTMMPVVGDQDGDGIDDFTELSETNTDPNPGGGELCLIEYGCLRIEPRTPLSGGQGPWLAAGLLALGLGFMRRRGRR